MAVIQDMEYVVETTVPKLRARGLLADAVITRPWLNRYAFGVTYRPWDCESYDVTGVEPELCGVEDNSELSGDLADFVTQPAFGLMAALSMSELCRSAEELDNIQQARFALYGSAAVASELMTGAISGGESLSSAADALGAATVDLGFALLEQELADRLGNGAGVVHLPPGLLGIAISEGFVVRVNGRFETVTGHAVAADGGYSGKVSPATGGSVAGTGEYWVYASGPVVVSTSAPMFPPIDGESFDFAGGRNMRELYADQLGVVWFDPCSVVAVKLDINSEAA